MANQGGTHEQHVKAGRQSHKNADDENNMKERAASSTSRDSQSGNAGDGKPGQQAKAGQQSHKKSH
jgi:hypothetical protein